MRRSSPARFAPVVIAPVLLSGWGAAPGLQDTCAKYTELKAEERT
jgi:hypothetical protein